MYVFLISTHVLISILLVVVVLLQAGKGGGLASAFGGPGGAGQSFFGGRGAATFLSKATVVLGCSFFVSAISLAMITASRSPGSSSLIQQEAQQQQQTLPALPAPTGDPQAVPGQSPTGDQEASGSESAPAAEGDGATPETQPEGSPLDPEKSSSGP